MTDNIIRDIQYKGYTIRKTKDDLSTRFELVIDNEVVMWDYNITYVKAYIDWAL